MREHWDYDVSALGRVEVKSVKCPRRGDAPDASLFYLETRCVGGGSGWLRGRADWVAFQQELDEPSFVLCRRGALERWADGALAGGMPMAPRSGVKGTRWSRPGRDDEVIVADRGVVLRALAPEEILWIN